MPCAQGETAPLDKTERAGLLLVQRGSCVCVEKVRGENEIPMCFSNRVCSSVRKEGSERRAGQKRAHGYQYLLYFSRFFFFFSFGLLVVLLCVTLSSCVCFRVCRRGLLRCLRACFLLCLLAFIISFLFLFVGRAQDREIHRELDGRCFIHLHILLYLCDLDLFTFQLILESFDESA